MAKKNGFDNAYTKWWDSNSSTTNFEIDSFMKVCYEYKCNWAPKIAEMLSTERESRNSVDR